MRMEVRGTAVDRSRGERPLEVVRRRACQRQSAGERGGEGGDAGGEGRPRAGAPLRGRYVEALQQVGSEKRRREGVPQLVANGLDARDRKDERRSGEQRIERDTAAPRGHG